MVDRHVIEKRIAAIRDRLERIAEVLPPNRDAFVADRTIHEVVAFNLLLAVQDALDLAAHVIADRGWGLPTTAREHFETLHRQGVLSSSVAAAMGGCAGLRNLIAHAYGSLDVGKLYDELALGRDALIAYCGELAQIE